MDVCIRAYACACIVYDTVLRSNAYRGSWQHPILSVVYAVYMTLFRILMLTVGHMTA